MQKKKVLNYRQMPAMLIVAIVGILIVSLLNFNIAMIVSFVSIVGIVILCISIKKLRRYKIRIIVLLCTYLVFVVVGGIVITEATKYEVPVKNAVIIATVNSDSNLEGIEEKDSRIKYELILTDAKYNNNTKELKGKISTEVVVEKERQIKVGDRVIIKGDILPKRVQLTESVNVYNYMNGIRYTIDNSKCVDIVIGKPSIRESIKVNCKEAMTKNVPAGGIIYSMIFGDKSVMESTFVSASRKTGIAHLFAVSGLHLGIVATLVGYITKKLKLHRVIDYLIVIVLSGLYAYLVGFGPSVARAFLMLVIYKSGKMFGLRHCGISSLALSGLIVLLINPLTLFNMSFQLSVMAMVGILFFERPIRKMIKTRWEGFNSFVAINLSVNICILPVTLYYFGSVSLIFFIANLLIVPLITLIFPVIFIVVIITAVIPYCSYILVPVGYVFSLMEVIVNYLATIPFMSITIKLSVYSVIGYILVLALISTYSLLQLKIKRLLSILLCVVVLTTSIIMTMGRIDGSIKIENVVSNTNYDILMVDIQDKHYLVVNGEMNIIGLTSSKRYIREKNIQEITGIVKTGLGKEDIEMLKIYKEELSIQSIVTTMDIPIVKEVFEEVYYGKSIGKYMIYPINRDMVEIRGAGKRILIADNRRGEIRDLPYQTDILYMLGETDILNYTPVQYYVNNEGVENNIPYSVNSYFTFIINNDKILVV